MTPRRFQLARERLARRQADLTVLLDGVHKPHNVSAILRSCDAVGVHRAHLVRPHGRDFATVSSTAQGADKWVNLQRHDTVADAARVLKASGHRLVAAHLDEGAVDFRELDLTRPTAFVLGTEKFGISASALELCDAVATIPMQGWVESLNVSVAAALLLFEAQRQRLAAGCYDAPSLQGGEYERTLFEWLHPQVARNYSQRGLPYPSLDENGDIQMHQERR